MAQKEPEYQFHTDMSANTESLLDLVTPSSLLVKLQHEGQLRMKVQGKLYICIYLFIQYCISGGGDMKKFDLRSRNNLRSHIVRMEK